jgi:putative FmdB family regulatory protein
MTAAGFLQPFQTTMPTYEYRCPKGHEFDLFQRMSDPPRADCPECGAESVRLLSSGAGFLFKGEGFYITDYRSEDYRKAAGSEKGTAEGESREGVKKDAAKKDSVATPPSEGAGKGDSSPAKAPGKAASSKKAESGGSPSS